MFWLLQLFTRIHAVPLSSPSHLIFDPSSLSVWLSCLPCFDSPLQDIASSIFLPLPASHCNAMQNCLSLLPKRRLHFSPSGFLPAMFFYLQCPFQTPHPSEPPPVSVSVLSFPNPSLAPRSLPRKVFSSPERCRLLAAGGRTPGFVRSLWTAAALCRGAGAACLQLLAERLHGDECLSLSPSRSLHALASLLSVCLTFVPSGFDSLPQALLPYLFSLSGYWAPPRKCSLKQMCNPPWGCPLCAAVYFWMLVWHLPHIYHLQYILKRLCDAQILKRLYGYIWLLTCLHVTVTLLHCKYLGCF